MTVGDIKTERRAVHHLDGRRGRRGDPHHPAPSGSAQECASISTAPRASGVLMLHDLSCRPPPEDGATPVLVFVASRAAPGSVGAGGLAATCAAGRGADGDIRALFDDAVAALVHVILSQVRQVLAEAEEQQRLEIDFRTMPALGWQWCDHLRPPR